MTVWKSYVDEIEYFTYVNKLFMFLLFIIYHKILCTYYKKDFLISVVISYTIIL